jgi:hypothetical protein
MLAPMHRSVVHELARCAYARGMFSCLLAGGLSFAGAFGCAYPRHTTPLNAAPGIKVPSEQTPGGMYAFRLISAVAPQTKISGLGWDDDGTGPDLFARIYVDERKVWESPVIENDPTPTWNRVLPRNVIIPRNSDFRLELWDYDTAVSSDPIGRIEHRGLPTTAIPDAMARLQLDAGTMVVIMVSAPQPHRGVGLAVEVREDALKVLSVEPFSPAARAGVKKGDQIVGIASARVADMEEGAKISELSLAAGRHAKLAITDANGKNEREVQLDGELTWLVL